MTSLSECLHIEHLVEGQIRRFAALNDAHRHCDMVDMFTPDGSFARPTDPDNPVCGRDNLMEFFVSRPKRLTCHVMANVVVDVISATEAKASSTVILYIGLQGSDLATIAETLVGGFDDHLVKQGEDWLFQSRRGYLTMKKG